MPNVTNLLEKPDYNTTIYEIGKKITDHDQSKKYVTTQEFNSWTADNFACRLKQASFACKFGITNFLERIY